MRINKVHKNGLGAHLELKPGDELIRINGQRVQDILDYRFRITEERVLVQFRIDGELTEFDIEKEYDEDLAVELEDFKIRGCANDCVFCFVDQNPSGMRKPLYFRDGDYRLSYLHGHYITMTNMGSRDLQRIVDQRLSPLYVSVHVTDPELRKSLFLYGKDDHLLEKMGFLIANGIEIHTQVVLMPTINDGGYLDKTLADLYRFYPQLKTVSIVPVGLTKHRDGLKKIPSVTPEYARKMVNLWPELQKRFPADSFPFVLLSDEWFIQADAPFPDCKYPEDVDLVENGVGQVQAFLDQFILEKGQIPKSFPEPREFSIVTGTLIQGVMIREAGTYLNSIENLKVNIYPIRNEFYGESVTVTGLLTGQDITAQLRGKQLGEAVWSTYRILNDDGTRTLDDFTLEDISDQLKVPFRVAQDSILEIFNRDISG